MFSPSLTMTATQSDMCSCNTGAMLPDKYEAMHQKITCTCFPSEQMRRREVSYLRKHVYQSWEMRGVNFMRERKFVNMFTHGTELL